MAVETIEVGNTPLPILKQLVDDLRAANKFVRESGAYYFQPHPKQELFFHPDRDHFPRFRVFLGGNRSGKTEAGALEMLSFALGERPWDGTKTPAPVPCRCRVIGSSYLDGIKKVIEPKIKRLWPKEAIAYKKLGQQGAMAEVGFKNGSVIDFLSAEQLTEKHEGSDLDALWVDEPISRDLWIANTRGLVDRGGHAWMTLTPLSEPWILTDIIELSVTDEDYFYVQATMYDNVNFGLTEEKVKKFESSLTEEERMVRIHGEFLMLQGLVFKEWKDHYWKGEAATPEDPGGHVIRPFEIPSHWPRFCGIDPHERTPTHVTWIAISEKQNAYVYDEAQYGDMNIKEMSEKILLREKGQISPPSRPVMRIIDPASARKSNVQEVGTNIRDEFMKNGVYTYPAINDIDSGHKAIREYLKFEQGMTCYSPRLFVFDTCTELRRSFRLYVWQEWKGPDKDTKEKKAKPRDKAKHPVDTLRYVLRSNPRYFNQESSRRERYVPANPRTGY